VATVDTNLGPVYVEDQGDVDEPVALLWPSLFTDHGMWRHQFPALRQAGFRMLALDPPGHGRSPGPGRGFTMNECAEAVVQVLDASSVRAPVVLLGTSWGGFVAPRVALRVPDRVRGLVLFNSSAERGTLFERMRAALLTKLLELGSLDRITGSMVVSGLLAPATRRQQPEVGHDLAQQFLSWERAGFITSVRSVLVDRDGILDALADVRVPTLVVSGQQDHTLPSIHSERIAANVPNAPHDEVAGAAHLVPLEAPREANSLILDFLHNLAQV
jgi:3-oxoadipate enol-lactonase